MKKILGVHRLYIPLVDPKDYIKIEKDDQHVDDKYVDASGKKFNEYDDLYKGGIIIRGLYRVDFRGHNYLIVFKKFKFYELYYGNTARKISRILNNKNSTYFSYVNFNFVKKRIVDIFSNEIKPIIE